MLEGGKFHKEKIVTGTGAECRGKFAVFKLARAGFNMDKDLSERGSDHGDGEIRKHRQKKQPVQRP